MTLTPSLKLTLSFALVCAVATGCTHVAPYDRARLAQPDMTRADLDGPAAEHVYAVHEGANGGGSVSESGCGCN
ncbi:MAG: DUF4266 domain-containing protein [Polyangiaceae bacterium]